LGRIWRRPGKRGWAIHLEDERVALDLRSTDSDTEISASFATPDVPSTTKYDSTANLYSVEPLEVIRAAGEEEVPFVHDLNVLSPSGERTRVRALFDGGAMVGAMSTSVFKKV
jgi:hypothetical protein